MFRKIFYFTLTRKKDKEKLKAKIYKQVDQLEDETALQMLQEAVTAYNSPSQKDIIDELTQEQQLRLKTSVQQVNEDKTARNDEVKKKAKEWLPGHLFNS